MSAAVDVSDSFSSWNKYEWCDAAAAATASGALDWRVRALVDELRRTCGTGEPDAHVPVVWRTASALADAIGYSRPTFRAQRDALIEADFLIEIASGRGPQKILVLRDPKTSELEALQMARTALEAYQERTGRQMLGWVDRALSEAVSNRRAAETADYQGGSADAQNGSEGQMKEQREADEKSFPLPLIYRERLSSGSDVDDQTDGDPTGAPTTANSNSSISSGQKTSVVDFDDIRTLRDLWRQAFDEYGRHLDEGVALKLSRAYADQLDNPTRLADGVYLTPSGRHETLPSRLARLFGNGTSTGQVTAFLLEDADTFFVPSKSPPPASEPQRKKDEPAPNQAGGNNAQTQEDPQLDKLHELLDEGLSYSEAFDEVCGPVQESEETRSSKPSVEIRNGAEL